jgi:hypothetical protein
MFGIFDIKPKQKPDSELQAFYREIWNERPHKSEINGAELPYNFCPDMMFVFSHVHSKASCPALILEKRNVVLMTLRQHHQWEFERDTLKDNPAWKFVFERFDELKPLCEQLKSK